MKRTNADSDRDKASPSSQSEGTRQEMAKTKDWDSSVASLHGLRGNQAVQALHGNGILQAKLKVNQPEDKYEREAERVAEQVMRMSDGRDRPVHARRGVTPTEREKDGSRDGRHAPAPRSASPPAANYTPRIQESPRAGGTAVDRPAGEEMERTLASTSGGRPLSPASRAFFEPRFGRDFGAVRIHTGGKAAEMNRTLSARAFTHGTDVHFGDGQFRPRSTSGKELLAHELTHVVQQSGRAHEHTAGMTSSGVIQRAYEPVRYDLGESGKDPYDMVQDFVRDVATAVTKAHKNLGFAIGWFQNYLVFEPGYTARVAAAVAKEVFDSAVNATIETIKSVPGLNLVGAAADVLYGSFKAIKEEHKKEAKAAQGVAARDWLNDFKENALKTANKNLTDLIVHKDEKVEKEFNALPGEWSAGDTVVTGEKGGFLAALEDAGHAAVENVPDDPPEELKAKVLTAFVTSKRGGAKGMVEPDFSAEYWGDEMGGKILLRYRAEKLDDGGYSYDLEDAAIVSKVKEANVRDALNTLLAGGLKVYEIGVPVNVMLQVEGVGIGRSYYNFWIYSRDNWTRRHHWPPALRAWLAMPWSEVDKVKKLRAYKTD